MNLILKFREKVAALSYALQQELEQLLTVIRTTFRAEHNDDGSHTDVTAQTISTASLTSSGIVAASSVHARFSATGVGTVSLVTGTAANIGYVQWMTPAGTRQGYLGWGASGVNLTLENSANLNITGGMVTTDNVVQLTEMTAPAAGASNTARLFCRDNGAGKSQVCVRFATGAIQVLATEP